MIQNVKRILAPRDFLGIRCRRSKICQYAAENRIDIIVMSTHGRTSAKEMLIGSVTEKMVRHAPCPILIMRQSSWASFWRRPQRRVGNRDPVETVAGRRTGFVKKL